jgi:hypothetical protein
VIDRDARVTAPRQSSRCRSTSVGRVIVVVAGAYLSRVSRCGLGNTVVSSWFVWREADVSASEGQPFSSNRKRRCFLGAKGDRETTRLIAKSGLKDTRRIDSQRFLKALPACFSRRRASRTNERHETRRFRFGVVRTRRTTDEMCPARHASNALRLLRLMMREV